MRKKALGAAAPLAAKKQRSAAFKAAMERLVEARPRGVSPPVMMQCSNMGSCGRLSVPALKCPRCYAPMIHLRGLPRPGEAE